MTFFRKHIMLRHWYCWLVENKISVLLFFLLLAHGAFLGLSDDEAYYWVLAQKPALGYAYHPPAVAWMIAGFQWLFGWMVGSSVSGLVRLPAALSSALILGLSCKWLRKVGLDSKQVQRAAWVLLSFYGFFSLSWMMVPDIPLFLGWTFLFLATWDICFGPAKRSVYFLLGAGVVLTVLSKYSGVLGVFSSSLCFLCWGPKKARNQGILVLLSGLILSSIPIVVWNSQHEWASILYQVRERHGGGISLLRYLRFWAIELLLAGPVLIGATFWALGKAGVTIIKSGLNRSHRVLHFVTIWAAPPAFVFCLQPLFSDFKPHWAFIVWWPIALLFAWGTQTQAWKGFRVQVGYGLTLGSIILLSCHLPIGNWAMTHFSQGPFDPRLDVTNDLYGWSELSGYLKKEFGDSIFQIPMIGSRYQTASQAAFSLGEKAGVTLLPRDIKERDEWPDLKVSQGVGPGWPPLKTPILYVSDIRYQGAPDFPSAECKKIGRYEKMRWNLVVKWIDIWRCDPRS